MQKGTLYFHGACFDGLVSGTLAWIFLEGEGWQFEDFIPMDYGARKSWLSTRLKAPAAVVDFLYHPDAEFWADHHPTTFLTANAREDFLKRQARGYLLFDEQAGSCATLLWNALRAKLPNAEQYRDAVSWAEKIDTASYSSVDEAIWGDSPALRIKQSLSMQNEPSYYRFLLNQMRSGDLNRTAQLAPVQERFTEVRRRTSAGIDRVRECIRLDGDVAVMDIESSDDDMVSRYAPYHFFPQARYSIGALRSVSGIAITAMRNPWMNFRSVPIGKILEPFGGGGHERVGSVLIPSDHSELVHKIVDRLIVGMQSHSTIESVAP